MGVCDSGHREMSVVRINPAMHDRNIEIWPGLKAKLDIYSLLKQSIKSCNAKRRRKQER